MKFSIVIPTLGTRSPEFVRLLNSIQEQTYTNLEVIVLSQDHHDIVSKDIKPYNESMNIQHIQLNKKGLSYSRNQAIPYISGDIVTFSDDDCWYPQNAFETVKVAAEDHPQSDVVCFQIFDPAQNAYYKNYPVQPIEKLNMRQVLQRSSIEIFINLNKINKNELLFNEYFGLGAKYPSGEENIMLSNLFKKGYQLGFYNQIVVYHAKPSQQSRLNLKSFMSKGPLFKQIFGTGTGLIMLTALFLKKFSHLERPFMFYLAALKEMFAYKKQ
ncbi:glycosyltransferase family 2 protein [Bacillus sp. OTU2372]|uniref:glycosyltransferase family 2 protein n=1 Tax=Bacillus sp. OTU2372 TaxID=3043858 RepID=UPI00313AD79A